MSKMKKETFPLSTQNSTCCGAIYHVIVDLNSLYRPRSYLPSHCFRQSTALDAENSTQHLDSQVGL
jgi:hypothetical protein